MQKGNNLQYVAAGVQAMPGMRMNVRSNVRLPDSEAGGFCAMERQPYYAEQVRPAQRRPITVPMNVALIFLCALFLVFGVMILNRTSQRAELAKRITGMKNSIAQTERDNARLALEVLNARDSARISEAAEQTCGMTASKNVETIPVVAPNTRPYETKLTVQADTSPTSAQDAMKLGSR
ncbi:MAG: hypothetical protein IKQ41_05990 [Clostridia bacterium]|nr:hypothetical protein [Clostridia bacterium]